MNDNALLAAMFLGFWLFMGMSCIGTNLPDGDTNRWDYEIAKLQCPVGEPE